jgi:hypothetical protein
MRGYGEVMAIHEQCRRLASGRTHLPTALPSRQFASVSNFAIGPSPHLRNLDCRHRGGVAIERRELDFKGLAVFVDVNDSADVTGFQTLAWNRRRQNNSLVLSDHADVSPLARIGRHQARRFQATIDSPNCTNRPALLPISVPGQDTIHNKFLTMRGFGARRDFSALSNCPQSRNQHPRILKSKAERLEELRLSGVVRMRRVQQIVRDLTSVDDREMRVSQFHIRKILSRTAPALSTG